MAKLYEDIERNVADAGVYQHLNHIATGRLFFPQEKLLLSGQRSEKLIITLESTENTSLLKIDICS